MKKRKKSQKGNSGKGWASFRVRGIKTSLFNLKNHAELSQAIRDELALAFTYVEDAVKILDKEKGEA
jgi:hypothetical protein